jgi:hypothetical protein
MEFSGQMIDIAKIAALEWDKSGSLFFEKAP